MILSYRLVSWSHKSNTYTVHIAFQMKLGLKQNLPVLLRVVVVMEKIISPSVPGNVAEELVVPESER